MHGGRGNPPTLNAGATFPRRINRLAVFANPQFRRLWASVAVSGVGDWAARIALTAFVFGQTGSALQAALVVGVSLLPWLGPGQWIVVRLTARSHREVMVGSDLVRAILWGAAAFGLPIPMLLLIAFMAECASVPFASRRSLALRSCVTPAEIPAAMGVANSTFQATVVIGYFVGSLSLLGSPRVALLMNAASFVLSAFILRTLRLPANLEPNGLARPAPSLTLLRTHLLGRGVGPVAGTVLFAMGLEALAVPYVLRYESVSALGVGAVAAAVPLTTLLTMWGGTRWDDAAANLRVMTRVSALVGAGGLIANGALAGVAPLLAAVAMGMVAGSAFATASAAVTVVVTQVPTHNSSAIVVSTLQATMQVAQAVGTVLVGLLADRVGFGATGAIAVALCVTCVVLVAATGPNSARHKQALGWSRPADVAESLPS